MSTFEGTRAIGETQSPTGSEALTKSVGQVGIYTTGHLLQSEKRMVSAVVTSIDLMTFSKFNSTATACKGDMPNNALVGVSTCCTFSTLSHRLMTSMVFGS